MKNMKRTKRILGVLFLASALITVWALAGCNAGGGESAAAGSSDIESGEDGLFTLRVTKQTIFNETNIADELGFFADEGIKIEYVGTLGQGVSEFQAVEQGDVDVFVMGHPPDVAKARLAGSNIKIVAPGIIDSEKYPHIRYLVKEDSPLTDFSQIIGKKIAVSSYSACTNGFINYYLLGIGHTPDEIEYITIKSDGGLAEQAALQGQIDITTSHAPYGTRALAAGGLRQLSTSWELFKNPASAYSCRGFSEDFIKAHPDVVQGFVNAMYRARLWVNANVDGDARLIIAKTLGLEVDDIQGFLYDDSKNMRPDYVEYWVNISEQIETWEKGAVNASDIYTNEFVPKEPPASDADLRWTAP